MKRIEIDLEVYKIIVLNWKYIDEPVNDVLRRLLLPDKANIPSSDDSNVSSKKGFKLKGVFLKYGTVLRAIYKRNVVEAVIKDGYIELEGEKFHSFSGAANKVSDSQVNGWTFWSYYDELDCEWKAVKTLK